ncbi:hypothetical protein AWU65_31030 [Paenibacillus glucanolyticus]|uniref:Tyr recombinase domain-containing protein n=1 Tax=Paenibacillus glucanolyticus TaxID=59843 RepID=A0A163FNK8_9BACL|nr:hypothetical protein AWU65_31030 [Paenibacillus glucanolyticus]
MDRETNRWTKKEIRSRVTSRRCCCECGMDLKTIQERLQHTKMDTRANIYIHRSEAINRSAADQLEELNPKWIKLAP